MKILTKILFVSFALLGLAADAPAQVRCLLSVAAPAQGLKAGDKFTAKLHVDIDPGWHISSLTTPDGGPVRTEIAPAKDTPAKLTGKITAPAPRREHSSAFDVDVETYEGEVDFSLPLQATADLAVGSKLAIEITFQACTEDNCLLPKTNKVETSVRSAASEVSKK